MTYQCPVCGEPITSNDVDRHEHWAIAMDCLVERQLDARADAYFEALAEQLEESSWM